MSDADVQQNAASSPEAQDKKVLGMYSFDLTFLLQLLHNHRDQNLVAPARSLQFIFTASVSYTCWLTVDFKTAQLRLLQKRAVSTGDIREGEATLRLWPTACMMDPISFSSQPANLIGSEPVEKNQSEVGTAYNPCTMFLLELLIIINGCSPSLSCMASRSAQPEFDGDNPRVKLAACVENIHSTSSLGVGPPLTQSFLF